MQVGSALGRRWSVLLVVFSDISEVLLYARARKEQVERKRRKRQTRLPRYLNMIVTQMSIVLAELRK